MGQAGAGVGCCNQHCVPSRSGDDRILEMEERIAEVRDYLTGEPSGVQLSQHPLDHCPEAAADASPSTPMASGRRRLGKKGSAGSTSSGSLQMATSSLVALTTRIARPQPTKALLDARGLSEVFAAAAHARRRAVALWSVTDKEGGVGSSFKEKGEEVLCPQGQDVQDELLFLWLEGLGLGWACKKGLKPDSPNQDSFAVLFVEDSFLLIGAFDGHGEEGHNVSQFVRERVIRCFLQHPKRATDTEAALHDSFLECQALVEHATQLKKLAGNDSGSTCTVVYVDLVKCQLTVAHVGDARCALARRQCTLSSESEADSPAWQQQPMVQDLTIDHKPNLENERKRIENADPPGRVIFDGYVNHRVFVQHAMYPGLNMSRAMGDVAAHKECGLTAVPDTKTVDLRPLLAEDAEVDLLVCTDGVWEFIESAEAFHIAEQVSHGGAKAVVNRLALESWDRWRADSQGEVCDDITAVYVQLHTLMAPTPG